MTSVDELLKPTLETGAVGRTAIYSTTAGFTTAFFGGPFAAVALTAINSWRLRRLRMDVWPLLAAAALSVLAIWLIESPARFGQPDLELGATGQRLLQRAFSLGLFGLFWLLHRRYYRNMMVMGIEPPNGWVVGLGCAVFGVLLSATLATVFAP